MGFNTVFKSLQELFPQIDSRVLRAVAIEHSKDPDAAVGAVLEEIIPFFTERSRPSSPLATTTSLTGTSQEVEAACDNGVDNQQCKQDAEVNAFDNEVDLILSSALPVEVSVHEAERTTSVSKCTESSSGKQDAEVDAFDNEVDLILSSTLPVEVSEVPEAEGTTSVSKSTESSSGNVTDFDLENHQILNVGVSESLCIEQEREDFVNCIGNDFMMGTGKNSDKEKSSTDGENSFDRLASLTIHDQPMSSSFLTKQCIELPETPRSFHENTESSLFFNDSSIISTTREVVGTDYEPVIAEMNTTSEVVGTPYGCTLDSSLSRSSQIRIVDVIDQSIAASKDNKKILFSAMESVISLMKELENKEQAAELAKKEAAMGGADIQDKVEELRKMLQHAKATNDMHAGEVYGERAILTTELRELQSRVISISDEKDKSLAVLFEMRRVLQVRLAAAEDKIKDAERERLEKEECARTALAEQELVMEKVVQEANLLKQKSEENAKLQELLLDRGHVLDVMQGELAVIYQDVRLLKENFDENVPFSKSVSSSQTSCKLASSGSSLRSPVPELETDGLEYPVDDLTSQLLDMNHHTFQQQPMQHLVDVRLAFPTDDLNSSTDQHAGDNKASKGADETLLDDEWQVLDNDFEREST